MSKMQRPYAHWNSSKLQVAAGTSDANKGIKLKNAWGDRAQSSLDATFLV